MFSLRFIGSGLLNLCFPCISMIFPGFWMRNIQKNKRFVVLGPVLAPKPVFSLRFIGFGLRKLCFPCVLLVFASGTYVFLAFP